MIERLHRRFLDMLRFELERLHIDDISAPQALMLTKIDDRDVAVRDLVERGYYLGSNASYNIRQMVQAGYVVQERSSHDRRSMRVRLTEKGRSLSEKIGEFEESHSKTLRDDPAAMGEIESANETLRRIERTWSDYLSYQEL
jgi:DNA-binding MarR family transcriptional regulator